MFLLAVALHKEGWIISWPSLPNPQKTQIVRCRVVPLATRPGFLVRRIHPKFENSETFTQPMTLIP